MKSASGDPSAPSQQDINYVVALQAQVENAQLRENLRTAWAVIGVLLETEHLGERRAFLPAMRKWWRGQADG